MVWVHIFCFSCPEEKLCSRKKQRVQDLIPPPSIYLHMCTLYTYTNIYMPRIIHTQCMLVPAWHIDRVRRDASEHLCEHRDVLWQGPERWFRVCIQRGRGPTQSAFGRFETHHSSCIHSSLYLLHQCVCLFVDKTNTPLTLQAYWAYGSRVQLLQSHCRVTRVLQYSKQSDRRLTGSGLLTGFHIQITVLLSFLGVEYSTKSLY